MHGRPVKSSLNSIIKKLIHRRVDKLFLSVFCLGRWHVDVQCIGFFIGTYHQVNDTRQEQGGNNGPDGEPAACEKQAQTVDNQ